jgi:hypothetical protein
MALHASFIPVLYTLETWFVSGIIVNTLHKGDNKDNNKLQDLRTKPGPIHKLKL